MNERPELIDWEEVARREIHSRRFGLLKLLSLDRGRTLSPSECAFELQTSVSDAHYHLSVLRRFRLVRLARTVPVRAVAEHFYCLINHDAADLADRLNPRKDTS